MPEGARGRSESPRQEAAPMWAAFLLCVQFLLILLNIMSEGVQGAIGKPPTRSSSPMGCFFAVCAILAHIIKYYARRGSGGDRKAPDKKQLVSGLLFSVVCKLVLAILFII